MKLKPGDHVRVPWGLEIDREGIVIEVWGDPEAPTQVRIELVPLDDDEDGAMLLLSPEVVTPAA